MVEGKISEKDEEAAKEKATVLLKAGVALKATIYRPDSVRNKVVKLLDNGHLVIATNGLNQDHQIVLVRSCFLLRVFTYV